MTGRRGTGLGHRLAIWLAETLVRSEEREFLVGDLLEEWDRRTREDGRTEGARSWSGRLNASLWWLGQCFGVLRHRWRPRARALTARASARRVATCRGSQRQSTVGGFWRDASLALRTMRRRPGSSLLIAATLGLGIGLTTVVYMLADAVLLRPLGYADPDKLVVVEVGTGEHWHGTSEPGLADLRELTHLEQVVGWTGTSRTLLGEPQSRRLLAVRSSANLLDTLGVRPAEGRFFDDQEDAPGGAAVVVVSHGFWQSWLGGSSEVVGHELVLDGEVHEIVGVLPSGFRYPNRRFDLYLPLRLDLDQPWDRNNHYLNVIARVAPGSSIVDARAEVEALGARTEAAYPELYSSMGHRTRLRGSHEALLGSVRTPVMLVLAAVVALLVLTCANVANLQLLRASGRERELAVRTSLGAQRGRLIAQLMTESLVLAISGAALGLVLALLGARLLPSLVPADLPRLDTIRFEPRILGVMALLAVSTALASGLWPALRSTVRAITLSVRTQSGSKETSLLRRGLVVGQMALAMLLLVGCGLLVRSTQELMTVSPGFDPREVLVFDLALPEARYDSPETVAAVLAEAERRLVGVAGVEAAGGMGRLPLVGTLDNWSIEIEGQPAPTLGEAPAARVQQVTPGVFEALRLELAAGRFFDDRDVAGREPVVVVNRAMAERFWPGERVLDKRLRVYDEEAPWMRVVGIVGDVRQGGLAQDAEPQWYVPHAQAFQTAHYSPRYMSFALRVDEVGGTSSSRLRSSVLAALRDLDPTIAIVGMQDYQTIVSDSLSLSRQLASWLALFSVVAVILAVLGLYGVLSASVSARHREIGVRMALGALPGQVLKGVVREGMALVAVGWLVGLACALVAGRAARSVLFGVEPADPAALTSVSLLLVVVALVASLLPARRASAVDPQECLRSE